MISPNNPKIPYVLYLRNETLDSLYKKKNSSITFSNQSMLKQTLSKENFNSNFRTNSNSIQLIEKNNRKISKIIPNLSTEESVSKLQEFNEFFKIPEIMFKTYTLRNSNLRMHNQREEKPPSINSNLNKQKKIKIKQLFPMLNTPRVKPKIIELKSPVYEEIKVNEVKKTQPCKKKESLINYKRKSTTISDGEVKNHRIINIHKSLNSLNKEKLVIMKPKSFNEHNEKIIEINKKKNFGFFKNSKKLICPSILISNKYF